MIIRARPKFLKGLDVARFMDRQARFPDALDAGFYFGSGRSALKFFLSCYSESLGRPVNVLLQAFNCTVVRDAVAESGNHYQLCDVGLEDFSIRLDILKKVEGVDVLVLLHYQGIPNIEYQAIADYCKQSGILLIEDLAHGDYSSVEGVRIGSRADVRLYSYAFDKPVSVLSGGQLALGTQVSAELQALLKVRYAGLPLQRSASALADVRLLFFLYQFTDEKNYHTGLNYYAFLRALLWLDWSLLQRFSKTRVFKLCAYAFGLATKRKKIPVFRLESRKISLVLAQEKAMAYSSNDVSWLERVLADMGVDAVEYPASTSIVWNRYSLLDPGQLLERLRVAGIEAGNFNWPVVLDAGDGIGHFPNAERVAREVVNIPVWTEFDV